MLASAKGFVPMAAKIARYALGSIVAKRRFLPYLLTDTRVLICANLNGDSALQGQEIIDWE
jgi:hypothetical protein